MYIISSYYSFIYKIFSINNRFSFLTTSNTQNVIQLGNAFKCFNLCVKGGQEQKRWKMSLYRQEQIDKEKHIFIHIKWFLMRIANDISTGHNNIASAMRAGWEINWTWQSHKLFFYVSTLPHRSIIY